jgi:two-component system response regulator NreC
MDTRLPPLSPREHQVFHLLVLGYTNGEIAKRLHLSVRTAESHRASLRRKLGLPTRAALVRYAVERGFFTEPGILELP